jgi:hypothetical protein
MVSIKILEPLKLKRIHSLTHAIPQYWHSFIYNIKNC